MWGCVWTCSDGPSNPNIVFWDVFLKGGRPEGSDRARALPLATPRTTVTHGAQGTASANTAQSRGSHTAGHSTSNRTADPRLCVCGSAASKVGRTALLAAIERHSTLECLSMQGGRTVTDTLAAHCLLLPVYCSLLTAHCSLPTAHCSLLTATTHYSLLTTHCSLSTAHCSQHAPYAYSSLPNIYTAHCPTY